MTQIKILDCTLRDGGYINNWDFGEKEINSIISNLKKASIDIIECGFVSNKENYSNDQSIFNSIEEISRIIPKNEENKLFVCMINYGEYDYTKIPINNDYVDGIRIAFHKKDRFNIIPMAKDLIEKGYKVFIQPMVTVTYSKEELEEFIQSINDIQPYAFYVADSFGMMTGDEILNLYSIIESQLNSKIHFGYHGHNNLQLAFSNAQLLIEHKNHNRTLLLDSSVLGMGRGAGNLNTELITQHINNQDNIANEYDVLKILEISNNILLPIQRENYWGYSLPYYLSAKYRLHPNYANYLIEEEVDIQTINSIFEQFDEVKKNGFDKIYIKELLNKIKND